MDLKVQSSKEVLGDYNLTFTFGKKSEIREEKSKPITKMRDKKGGKKMNKKRGKK